MKHHQASAPTFVGKPCAKQVRSPVHPRHSGEIYPQMWATTSAADVDNHIRCEARHVTSTKSELVLGSSPYPWGKSSA